VLLQLPVEEDVSGPSIASVARHKERIECFQGLSIGKLRKDTGAEVLRRQGPELDAKESGTQWRERIGVFFDCVWREIGVNAGFVYPGLVMHSQVVAVRVAEQSSTIAYLRRHVGCRAKGLKLRYRGKPSTESLLVGSIVQA